MLGSNLLLDGNKLEITLYKPFDALALCREMFDMVPPARLELATNWFEASYSNPLSYGGVM